MFQVIYKPLPGPYEPLGDLGMVESPPPNSGIPGNYAFPASTTAVTLSALTSFTNYTVSVFASTSAGGGNVSSLTEQTEEAGEWQ